MAITRHSSAKAKTTGTTLTFAYDVGSSTNRVLLVAVVVNGPTTELAGVTYNGDAMTLKISKGDNCCATAIYSLDDPDVGSNNVVITVNSSIIILGTAVSYDDAGTVTTTQSAGSPDSPPALSITTTANNSMVVDNVGLFVELLVAPDGSQSLIQTDASGNNSQGVSDILKVTAGAQTMGWSTSGAAQDDWDYVAVEVTQDAAT